MQLQVYKPSQGLSYCHMAMLLAIPSPAKSPLTSPHIDAVPRHMRYNRPRERRSLHDNHTSSPVRKGTTMAGSIDVEIIPKQEAEQMVRIRRMDAEFRERLATSIRHVTDNPGQAVKLAVERERYLALRRRIEKLAQALAVPLTIRRTGEGLVFWKATAEELETRPPGPPPRRRRRNRR
jgi:hypothetical protein